MAIEQIKMPQLGESVTEGTIEKWLVQPGDKVNKYDSLAEVNTDKVTAEIPSSFTGVIKELIANEGDTLDVGAVVCTIETEGESGASTEEMAPEESPSSKEAASEMPAAESKTAKASIQREKGSKARYSPAVLKIAQENDIDLTLVNGTGNEGRITRKDLLAIIESGNIPTAKPVQDAPHVDDTPAPSAAQATKSAGAPTIVPVAVGDIE
ncbi:MAG: biotin/lipoyl-containing protein, partial [Paenisporosarcina sp.]